VEKERYIRNGRGHLVARPPADIAYRLTSWYQMPGVTAGTVVEALMVQRTRRSQLMIVTN